MSSKSGGAKASRKDDTRKVVADNRRARFDYEILDTYEAGIELKGTEVKSLRSGKANLGESYASVKDGELYLVNAYIPEYREANRFNHEPRRPRKLLLAQARDRQTCRRRAARWAHHRAAQDLLQSARTRQGRHRLGQGQEAPRQARDHQGTLLGSRAGAG